MKFRWIMDRPEAWAEFLRNPTRASMSTIFDWYQASGSDWDKWLNMRHGSGHLLTHDELEQVKVMAAKIKMGIQS